MCPGLLGSSAPSLPLPRSAHTGTSLSQKPGLENLGMAGGFQLCLTSLWTGTEEKWEEPGGLWGSLWIPPEESDYRNTLRSKFIGGAAVEPPPPLGKAEDTAPTQGWTDRSHMDTQVEQTHRPAQPHRHRNTQATAPKNTHTQQTKAQN